MLIFVYGEDTFRVRQKVQHMRNVFKEKFDPTGINFSHFVSTTKKIDVGEVMSAVHASPFLGQKRMVLVEGLMEQVKKNGIDVWKEGFTQTPESTIVIFIEPSESGSIEKKPLYKELSGFADIHHYTFPVLQGKELRQWIQTRVQERNGTIQLQALQALMERVGSNLWQMDHEIHKLVSYANSESISRDMVELLVHSSFEGNIFQLIDAISKKQMHQAVRLLKEERWSGASDHYLLTMLGRQVKILLGARALLNQNAQTTKADLASTLSIHPFVAQKALTQARGFTLEQLKLVHGTLFQYDVQMKKGQIDADMAMDMAMIKLME